MREPSHTAGSVQLSARWAERTVATGVENRRYHGEWELRMTAVSDSPVLTALALSLGSDTEYLKVGRQIDSVAPARIASVVPGARLDVFARSHGLPE